LGRVNGEVVSGQLSVVSSWVSCPLVSCSGDSGTMWAIFIPTAGRQLWRGHCRAAFGADARCVAGEVVVAFGAPADWFVSPGSPEQQCKRQQGSNKRYPERQHHFGSIDSVYPEQPGDRVDRLRRDKADVGSGLRVGQAAAPAEVEHAAVYRQVIVAPLESHGRAEARGPKDEQKPTEAAASQKEPLWPRCSHIGFRMLEPNRRMGDMVAFAA
jgi:hypothetical protein